MEDRNKKKEESKKERGHGNYRGRRGGIEYGPLNETLEDMAGRQVQCWNTI